MLLAFLAWIGFHYNALRGEDCSCFPWIKRAVGPGFFIGDGVMLLLAVAAGLWARPANGVRPAAVVLGAVAVFTLFSYGYAATRHSGVKAPATITAQDGHTISLTQGKVFIYFFNP